MEKTKIAFLSFLETISTLNCYCWHHHDVIFESNLLPVLVSQCHMFGNVLHFIALLLTQFTRKKFLTNVHQNICLQLTLSWRRPLSYRNQSIPVQRRRSPLKCYERIHSNVAILKGVNNSQKLEYVWQHILK